jgi:SAM-dependent methyltransferase
MTTCAGDYQTSERMALKLKATPLPADLTDKSVLDVGCDHGFWSHLASERGASRVLGIDRGRGVRGAGFVDLVARNRAQGWLRCEFAHADVGKEWPAFGRFDVVLALAIYHHLFGNCGDHERIWQWFRDHTAEGGLLLWDGPLDLTDPVARMRAKLQPGKPYDRRTIIGAAERYYVVEDLGPALYRKGRTVLRCAPK